MANTERCLLAVSILWLLPLTAIGQTTHQTCLRAGNGTRSLPPFNSNYKGQLPLERVQVLISSYQFQCNGSIGSWAAYLQPENVNNPGRYLMGLQVFRRRSNRCYSLVGSDASEVNISGQLFQRELNTDQQIDVQIGDALGYYFINLETASGLTNVPGVLLSGEHTSEAVWYGRYSRDPTEGICAGQNDGDGINLPSSTSNAPIITVSLRQPSTGSSTPSPSTVRSTGHHSSSQQASPSIMVTHSNTQEQGSTTPTTMSIATPTVNITIAASVGGALGALAVIFILTVVLLVLVWWMVIRRRSKERVTENNDKELDQVYDVIQDPPPVTNGLTINVSLNQDFHNVIQYPPSVTRGLKSETNLYKNIYENIRNPPTVTKELTDNADLNEDLYDVIQDPPLVTKGLTSSTNHKRDVDMEENNAYNNRQTEAESVQDSEYMDMAPLERRGSEQDDNDDTEYDYVRDI